MRSANATSEADALLKTTREEAEAESVRIKAEAVEQEKRVRQLSATVRSMLSIEIDGVEKSVREASELMAKAQSQLDEKIAAVNSIIAQARSSVEENAKVGEERMDDIMSAPAPESKEIRETKEETPKASAPKLSPSSQDDFAESMLSDFAAAPNLENNFKTPSVDNQPTPMPKPGKKLNFDMSELIKDAEASISE